MTMDTETSSGLNFFTVHPHRRGSQAYFLKVVNYSKLVWPLRKLEHFVFCLRILVKSLQVGLNFSLKSRHGPKEGINDDWTRANVIKFLKEWKMTSLENSNKSY